MADCGGHEGGRICWEEEEGEEDEDEGDRLNEGEEGEKVGELPIIPPLLPSSIAEMSLPKSDVFIEHVRRTELNR